MDNDIKNYTHFSSLLLKKSNVAGEKQTEKHKNNG